MTIPQPKQFHRLKVLIADDILETRRGTRLMLAIHPGVEVVAIAHNGQQAVELAQQRQPDIAIMDINMPELNGIAAMQQIKQNLPQTVFIIVSSDEDAITKKAAAEAGALEYLQKPFTYEELDTALKRAARSWMARKQRAAQAAQPSPITPPDRAALTRLAHEYAQARRSDAEAVAVYERLALYPDCELRWLMTLAMSYVLRQEWGKLKLLAEILEHRRPS